VPQLLTLRSHQRREHPRPPSSRNLLNEPLLVSETATKTGGALCRPVSGGLLWIFAV